MKKSQNIILYIIIGILAVGLLIATMFIGEKEVESIYSDDPNVIIENAERESASITDDEMKALINISMDEYLTLYSGAENSIVFVARPTCPYCEITEPIIRKIAKDYNIKINYLNTDEFSEDDRANFVRHNEMFSEGYGTPMILVVSNNQIVTYFEGLTDTAHFIEFFKANNII